MAIQHAGCGGGEAGFSWQFPHAICVGVAVPQSGCVRERGVLMAVPDAGCGG